MKTPLVVARTRITAGCATHLGERSRDEKAKVFERKPANALVRMDCGWGAIGIVAHTGKDAAREGVVGPVLRQMP